METDDPLKGHPLLQTVQALSKNSSSTVVLARNLATGQLLAVKLYQRGFDDQAAKYLLRELLNHYELTLAKHPHVVSLVDCFLTPQHLAVVLEYVDGENLQVFLEKAGGCVVEALARFLFQQLVIALDFCQSRGKVNRNIRPSSLLLQLGASALPLLKLSDFSFSKDTLRHSQPRSQVGTAMYCAPEVLTNFRGAAYDAAAADVWSVGVVLFGMLFGRHPYARPEDAQLPAAQQVIAMFKRVTAPAGSVEGELHVPDVLPTSVLPGAQPGAQLSPAAASMLRGLLARDPRVRLTLEGVQQHEWFRTSLPEGAALLNTVVATEAAAAGEAAMLSPAAAVQLERMVMAAAAGPTLPLAASLGGGAASSGYGGGQPHGCVSESVGGGGVGTAGVAVTADADADAHSDAAHAAKRTKGGLSSPQEAPREALQHPPPQPEAPLLGRTVTTCATSDVASSTPAGGTPQSQLASNRPYAVSGGSAGDAPSLVSPKAANAAAAASAVAREGAAAAGALWSAFSTDSGQAVGARGDDDDALLMDLEELVMGVPEDDLLAAASLDFMLSASVQQQQQQVQQQQQQESPAGQGPARMCQQQQQQQPAASGTTSGAPAPWRAACGVSNGGSAPASADTTEACAAQTPALQLTPLPRPPAPDLHPRANGGGNADGVTPNAVTAARQAPPALTVAAGSFRLGQGSAGGAGVVPSPPLFASMRSIASGSVPNGGEYAASLLARLRTDSLPSPHTLAVVDARPFLAEEGESPRGLFRGESSMLTIPSTYTMDWCTLSMRSENLLLSPSMLRPADGAAGSNGGGGGAALADGGGSGAPSQALLQGSMWHRICHEARGTVTRAGTPGTGSGLGSGPSVQRAQ